MKFGRLSPELLKESIFQLPPWEERSFLSFHPKTEKLAQIFFGAPVFARKDWVGKVYPKGSSPQDYLKIYAQKWNALEFNATFYHIPRSSLIQKWCSQVPGTFQFCLKVFQGITHQRNSSHFSQLDQCIEAWLQFQEYFGCAFFQLPPEFDFSYFYQLKNWISRIPEKLPIAVEFRHLSWWDQGKLKKEVFQEFIKRKVCTVITDTPGKRNFVHGALTSDFLMIRFLGGNLDSTDFLRIRQWIQHLLPIMHGGLKKLYFFIHQPNEGLVPELTDFFIEEVQKQWKVELKGEL